MTPKKTKQETRPNNLHGKKTEKLSPHSFRKEESISVFLYPPLQPSTFRELHLILGLYQMTNIRIFNPKKVSIKTANPSRPFRPRGKCTSFMIVCACVCTLPKLIGFGIVFQTSLGHFVLQCALVNIHIRTQIFQRRIGVAQLHVDETHQHHRVFRHLIHIFVLFVRL